MYQYQVGFGEAVKRAFSAYCNFSGRASRSEYWWFVLFNFLVGTAIVVAALLLMFAFCINNEALEDKIMMGEQIVSWAYSLAVFLPSLGLTVRRLHDVGKGGGWIFISLLPVVGWIILLVWECQDSQPMDNRFGPVPNLTDGQIRY